MLLVVGIAGGFGAEPVVTGGSDRAHGRPAQFDTDRVANGSGNLVIAGDDEAGGTLRVHGMPSLRATRPTRCGCERDGEVIPKAMFNVGQDGDGADRRRTTWRAPTR